LNNSNLPNKSPVKRFGRGFFYAFILPATSTMGACSFAPTIFSRRVFIHSRPSPAFQIHFRAASDLFAPRAFLSNQNAQVVRRARDIPASPPAPWEIFQ